MHGQGKIMTDEELLAIIEHYDLDCSGTFDKVWSLIRWLWPPVILDRPRYRHGGARSAGAGRPLLPVAFGLFSAVLLTWM